MTTTVVTVVSGRPDPDLMRAAGVIRATGADISGHACLSKDRAMDFFVPVANEALTHTLRQKFQNFGDCDIFIQNDDAFRKKKLLVADMDATIIEGETLDDLAATIGIKDKIAPITAAAMRGEIDFGEALRQRIALLKGLPLSTVLMQVAEMKPSRGAVTAVKTMNKFGAKCVLISGGFDMFTAQAAMLCGFYKNIGNRLNVIGDHLTGEVMQPIVDKETKKKTLLEECRILGLDPRASMAVGDGANDIPMLQAAGTGVGYFGKPAVQAATPYQIMRTDLTSLLFMQGYREEEFAY